MSWFTLLFNKLIRVFKNFLTIAIPPVKAMVMAELKDFAISTVKKLEVSTLVNNDRRISAFNDIYTEAQARGIKIGTSSIYLLIELALQYLKSIGGIK